MQEASIVMNCVDLIRQTSVKRGDEAKLASLELDSSCFLKAQGPQTSP